MRTIAIIAAFCLLSVAFAAGDKVTFTMELEAQARASGAIDTVLELLMDLKKASNNERADWEARNKTWEEVGQRRIAELTEIYNTNLKNYESAVEHREFIEKEVEDTENHIIWIDNRLAEIERKLQELHDQRCQANFMFIDALREHIDGIKAVKILQEEINRMHANGELAQIKSVTDRLKAYEHLFEKDAVDSFLQLAGIDDVTGFEDNDKGALELKTTSTNPGQRNLKGTLVEKVLQMIAGLIEHLEASIKNLEEHEIQAAFDYANFKSSSAVENVTLRADRDRKEKYLAQLEIDVEVARETEDEMEGIKDESKINLDNAIEELNIQRETYAQNIARIAEESAILDTVIDIFKQRVATLQQSLSNRVDQHQEGDDLTKFARKADTFEPTYKGL